MNAAVLVIVVVAIEAAATTVGILVGRWAHRRGNAAREPVGVVQATVLGLVGLLLAFGLSMAVDRYETRRELIVSEANAIGTTYLRAQTLDEPFRSASLDALRSYSDSAVALSEVPPSSTEFNLIANGIGELHRRLWEQAGGALQAAPEASAPRLYAETLNEMIDVHAERTDSLRNRVPSPVLVLLVAASAIALVMLALYLTMLGRGVITSLVATAVVALTLLVTFDLDRPSRGFITVPNTPLVEQRATMDDPPAFAPADT